MSLKIGESMSICAVCNEYFIVGDNPDWKENYVSANIALQEHYRKEHELN